MCVARRADCKYHLHKTNSDPSLLREFHDCVHSSRDVVDPAATRKARTKMGHDVIVSSKVRDSFAQSHTGMRAPVLPPLQSPTEHAVPRADT